MAGIQVGAMRIFDHGHGFGDFSRTRQYHDRTLSESSMSESYSVSNCFQSHESSVDLTPDSRFERMLRRKHSEILPLMDDLRNFDHFSCFFAMSGLFLALLSCEISTENYRAVQILLVIVTVSTALLEFCIVSSWKTYFAIKREKKVGLIEGCDKTFIRSSLARYMYFELLLYTIQPLPFIDFTFEVYQLSGLLTIRLNEILTSFMLLRVFICIKLLRHHSKWTNEHSSAICDMYAAKATEKYAFKALLIEKPVELMIPLLLISALILSIALRMYEKNFTSDVAFQDYSYLWNSMWLILLTMTTVGYGDFYPMTHPGRFICALSAYWGIFIVSMIVLTLTNFSHLNSAQQRSYNFLKRLRLRNRSKNYACVFITTVIQTIVLNFKGKVERRKNVEYLIKLKTYFAEFKKFQRLYIQVEKTPEEMLRIINEKLRIELENLESKIRDAKDFNSQLESIVLSQNNTKEMLKECKNDTMEMLRFHSTSVKVEDC